MRFACVIFSPVKIADQAAAQMVSERLIAARAIRIAANMRANQAKRRRRSSPAAPMESERPFYFFV
jgi:hypothetical protein